MRDKILLVDWDADQAADYAASLEAAGWSLLVESGHDSTILNYLQSGRIRVVVISLSKFSNRGASLADAIYAHQENRSIPLVFIDGSEEVVCMLRQKFTDALFTSWQNLQENLVQILSLD